MTDTPPWRQHNYIGNFANDALATANVVARGWDLAGSPQDGMCYYNTTIPGMLFWNSGTASWGNAVPWGIQQGYYVGKHGNDANDGLTPQSAVLTIGQAVTLATAQAPTTNNRFVIRILDDGIYNEDVTMVSFVDIYGPFATIQGTGSAPAIQLADDCYVKLGRVLTGAFTFGISLPATETGTAIIDIEKIESTATVGVINLSANGVIIARVRQTYVQTVGAFGYGDLSSVNGHIHLELHDIYLVANNTTGLARTGAGTTVGYIHHILESGSPTGTTGINVLGGTVDAQLDTLSADTAYTVGAGATLNLFCSSISGTKTAVGTVNKLVVSDESVLRAPANLTELQLEHTHTGGSSSAMVVNMNAGTSGTPTWYEAIGTVGNSIASSIGFYYNPIFNTNATVPVCYGFLATETYQSTPTIGYFNLHFASQPIADTGSRITQDIGFYYLPTQQSTGVFQTGYGMFIGGASGTVTTFVGGHFTGNAQPNGCALEVGSGNFSSPTVNGRWFNNADMVLGGSAMVGTEKLAIILNATEKGIFIDNDTTDAEGTKNIIDLDIGLNNNSVLIRGIFMDLNDTGGAMVGAGNYGLEIQQHFLNTGQSCVQRGIRVLHDGSYGFGAGSNDIMLFLDNNCTLSSAQVGVQGINVDFNGMTLTNYLALYGINLTMKDVATESGNAYAGLRITDGGNDEIELLSANYDALGYFEDFHGNKVWIADYNNDLGMRMEGCIKQTQIGSKLAYELILDATSNGFEIDQATNPITGAKNIMPWDVHIGAISGISFVNGLYMDIDVTSAPGIGAFIRPMYIEFNNASFNNTGYLGIQQALQLQATNNTDQSAYNVSLGNSTFNNVSARFVGFRHLDADNNTFTSLATYYGLHIVMPTSYPSADVVAGKFEGDDDHVVDICPPESAMRFNLGTATGDRVQLSANLNTTDGNFATLYTLALDDNTAYLIEVHTTQRRTGGTAGTAGDSGGLVRRVVFKRTGGGNATIVGATSNIFTARDQATFDQTFAGSTTNVLIRVRGATNNNVSHGCTIIVQKISS